MMSIIMTAMNFLQTAELTKKRLLLAGKGYR